MYTEDTAGPGLWKSTIVGLSGLWLLVAAFIVPAGPPAVYNYWLVGLIATNAAIAFSGNRRWERPLAAGVAIWLFISGFVPTMLSGRPLRMNELVVGVVLLVAAVSANLHLRDDIRHARPLSM
jgi:hypothetical protein